MTQRILPTFIIVGAPRSGTTSLARYLGTHPELFMAARKEIHFFDLHFHRGVDWYARQFARAGGKAAVGEATPRYLFSEDALARMAQTVPRAKLIVLLRNPVDRAYSHYWSRRARRLEPLTFEEIVAADLPALDSGASLTHIYLEQSRYLKYLQLACRHFPREAVLVEIFEELRDAPGRVFASVCRFLGIAEEFVPPNLGRVVNRFVEFRSQAYRKVTSQLPRGVRRLVERVNIREATYPVMAPAVRAALEAAFQPENAALAAWLGRDLSVWAPSRPQDARM